MLEAFCAREWPRLVGALSLHCGDQALAEELAQEALERACRRWASVSAMQHPGAWVHRVAMNLAASRFRRAAAGRRAAVRHGVTPSTVGGPDADQLAVRDAVAALPTRARTAVVLRYHLDYSPDEAGEVMGCSGQAVRNLTHRALRTLRSQLGHDEAVLGSSTEGSRDEL
jgi:RNA polymerase sigma-70 factor (ECF subfamily)